MFFFSQTFLGMVQRLATVAALLLPFTSAFLLPSSPLPRVPSYRSASTRTLSMQYGSLREKPLKVIIAGGGIGGLVLANALQRHGIEYDLYEKTREYRPFGGPIQVQSNALAALEAINKDMTERIMAAGTTTGNRVNGLKDGVTNKWYCQFDTGAPAQKRGLPLTRVVDRPDLQSILLEYMDRSRLHTGVEVAEYTQLADGSVDVTLTNGERVQGDVLVGADGIWSNIRGQMHSESPGKESATYSGYTCFTGVCLARPHDVKEVAYKVYLASEKYFVCSDVGKGRMQWYAMLGQPSGKKVPDGVQGAHLIKEYQGWSREVLELLEITKEEDINQRDLYDRPPLLLKGWAKGPVAVLGDAAHPMMPNLGQGGCQAVEDGYRLAQELSKITDRGDVAWALRMYENQRLVRSSAVHGLARIASDVLFQSKLLFSNPVIGSFVGLMMTISMPLILEFLYQNVLDESDWGNAKGRLSNMAAYEDQSNTYKSVREAQQALASKERQLQPN
ncbi:zeaxanthin epoxidase [Nannochloropsis gaditana]|uniref:Zeaxanthin epoxidase n=1 Tax=Nannochloropsis gaditana TaxID=72520 RepID=W7U2K1_9STRA|nr:zeaxanthin epoxidase [Nannochloropsis gaditana]